MIEQHHDAPVLTTSTGCPVNNPNSSQRIGNQHGGLLLLQDSQLLETLAHFARERIPERVVHAKGAGAFGEFEVTKDVSDITSAHFLREVGIKTKIFTRFSTVGPERGSADSIRDVRGWAFKFFTEEGNLDWVFNNTPVFFIRDPIKFVYVNHSHEKNPRTNLADPDMFWDFHGNNQESIHQLMQMFTDRGTPYSYRHMNGYSGHTYVFYNKDGVQSYVKIHVKSDQGIKNFTNDEAIAMKSSNPDHHTQDLYDAIDRGEYPSWTFYLQSMDVKQAESYRWNVFDMTKVWPHADFPLREFGRLTLNRNPSNYFVDVEQAAFSPLLLVPGIAASADPVLQVRLFSYPDAARYRLGVNYQQLSTNSPLHVHSPYQRDGRSNIGGNYGGELNYGISSYRPDTILNQPKSDITHQKFIGEAVNFTSETVDDDYVQARMLREVLGKQEGQQMNLVNNIAGNLKAASKSIQSKAFEMFDKVDRNLSRLVEEAVSTANGKVINAVNGANENGKLVNGH